MNRIVAVSLIVCGLLGAMEQKQLLKTTQIEQQVLGYASKTGKIITKKECPDASFGDVAVSPSGEFLAIMKGDWLSVARVGKEGSTAIGEPVRIKKFAGSLLFLDDVRFLIFREHSFKEYAITQNDYGSYSFNRVSKTVYEEGDLFAKMPLCEPGALLANICIVPLHQKSTEKSYLQSFQKLSGSWSSANLSASDITERFIGSVSNKTCVVGNPETGVLDWLLYFDENNPHDMSKGDCFIFEKMCFVSVASKILCIGYTDRSSSELYTMASKKPSLIANIPIAGTAIRKVFWKDDGSECLVVKHDGESYLISDIPVISDIADND